jgi:predicted nucleic acid-binding protein
VTGLLGILIRADRGGNLSSLSEAIRQLEEKAGFWISDRLRDQILGTNP